jgi:signal transduction histidine kinase
MDAQESEIYISVIIAVVVVSGAVGYFFYSVLKQHKRVLHLERENSKAQVEMLEKDRSRIATDLHDDLAPMLAAVKMRINSFDLSNENDQKQLAKTNQAIDDIAKQMRSISFDLMPSTLQEKGLKTAVKEFVNYISLNNELKIRLMTDEEKPELSEQKMIHVYRIIQEIIHNTIKHAQATELMITMKKEKAYFVVSTRDKGLGFDYPLKLKANKGLGLKSLQNRVHLLKAEWEIDSKPGKGTAIIIRIPTANDYTVHKN